MTSDLPAKPFVYLVQAAEEMPYADLPDEACDVILLTWKRPAASYPSIFFPHSSWNAGRNRLLAEAVERAASSGNDYLYYIFMDEDCRIEEDAGLARRLERPLTGNPFRTFESCLLEWQPALGYTRYAWQYYRKGREVNLGYNIDAIFNAFHREAVPFLLPYYTGFDADSWLYSQNIINHLLALVYHPYRIQFNLIITANRRRRSYLQRQKDWTVPTLFVRDAVKGEFRRRIDPARPNSIYPPPGDPLKKNRSYVISKEFVEKHFNARHPFMESRQYRLEGKRIVRDPPRP